MTSRPQTRPLQLWQPPGIPLLWASCGKSTRVLFGGSCGSGTRRTSLLLTMRACPLRIWYREGYFAVDYAAKHYSAEQGNFTTYLSYALLKQIRTATCGEHTRVVATENGRRVAVSANPLNECSSLDIRLDESDEGSSTKGETIEDPAAVQAFQQAEDDIYTEELHTALETAMTQHLTEREATVLRSRYYDEKSLRAVGVELGVQAERVRQIEGKAIRKMKGLSSIQRWHDDVISTRAWCGTGFSAWKGRGSVQERSVEYWERQVQKYEARLQAYAEKYGSDIQSVEERTA